MHVCGLLSVFFPSPVTATGFLSFDLLSRLRTEPALFNHLLLVTSLSAGTNQHSFIHQSVISIGMGACWWHEVARAHTPRVLTYRSQQELQCLVSYTGLRCVIVTSEAPNAPPNASRNGKLKLLAPPLSDQSFGACFFSPYCRSLFRCSSRSSTTACSIL